MNAYIKYIAPISLSALLIACGSGGGKGASQTTLPSQPNKENHLQTNPTNSKQQETEQAPPVNQPHENNEVARPIPPKKALEEKATEPKLDKSNEDKINIASEIDKAVEKWSASGGSEYNKDHVRIYRIIENDKNEHDDDLNIKEIKPEFIQLAIGTNYDNGDYAIKLLDENFYYGYYRDSVDKKTADIHYIYSFKESAENKGTLSGLNATYQGEFIYTVKSIPNLPTRSNVYLKYENGEAMGKVTSIQDKPGRELFHINSDKNNIRTLIFNPAVEDLDNAFHEKLVVRQNSPDRIAIDTHFINGQDGTENKHLVGKGGNEKYWGVLGATKVEK